MAVDSSSETAKQQLTVCEQAGPACLRKPVMLARIRFLPQGCLAVWKTPYTDLGYPVSHQPCHVTSTKCEEVVRQLPAYARPQVWSRMESTPFPAPNE